MNLSILLPLSLYFLAVFGVSIYAYLKREKSQPFADYFIGNRMMGGFLLAMTLVATYISASSFIGGPGAAYQYGLGWVLLAVIQVPTVLLSLTILGKKFAILARKYNAITLSDLLLARYKSRLIVWLTSLILILAFIATMAVQFIGGARVLASVGIPYGYGLIIFSVFTIFYTALGGFRAGIFNDAFQGIVMIMGALILLIAIIIYGGGFSVLLEKLNAINPALLTPQGPNHFLDFPFMTSFWILVCFGVVGLPHTAIRCMAYKDSKALHQAILIGTIVLTIIMLTMHLSGALGRAILPNLTIPDEIIPTLIIHILPPTLAGIFLAAPLAAIMSTVNSQLLQLSSILVKDLYLSIRPKTNLNSKAMRYFSITTTFIFGMIVLAASWNPPNMIIWLNLLAFGGLEAAFLWPLVLGLYWNEANRCGALASLISGTISYLILVTYDIKLFNYHPIVPALLIGLIFFIFINPFGIDKKGVLTCHGSN